MPAPGSVTVWIDELRKGEPGPDRERAALGLWERYGARLVALAQGRLGGAPRRFADEEDVALDVFDSFCRGAALGKFPQADRREQLLALLAAMVRNKAEKLVRRERRKKRGGGGVLDEAALGGAIDRAATAGLPPDVQAELREQWQRLFEALGTDRRRAVLLGKLEGAQTAEIAAQLGCGLRTVEREWNQVLSILREELGDPEQVEAEP